jgi:SOS regulatory protein LexA
MKDHFELKSFGSVQKYLQYLIKEGLLESNWNERRGIVVNEVQNTSQTLSQSYYDHDLITLPMLGEIAAGKPIEAIEQVAEKITFPKTLFPKFQAHEKYFALTVKGDSMINAGILSGDLVIIKHQKVARNNEIVAAMINDDVTLKNFKHEGKTVQLISSNPKYSPIQVDESHNFELLGVLVGLIRTY